MLWQPLLRTIIHQSEALHVYILLYRQKFSFLIECCSRVYLSIANLSYQCCFTILQFLSIRMEGSDLLHYARHPFTAFCMASTARPNWTLSGPPTAKASPVPGMIACSSRRPAALIRVANLVEAVSEGENS